MRQKFSINVCQIEERGGKCIPVQCDHSKGEEIEKLFEKIKSEQDGQLDVLVNNVYSAVKVREEHIGKPISVYLCQELKKTI